MKKVLFISNIGLTKKTVPNGVNIKNRHILKYLKKMNNIDTKTVDTDNWKLRVIPLFFQIVWNSLRNDKIVLSINTKSAYQIIKFLNLLGLEDRLIYFVVGGSLHNQIENGSLNKKKFCGIRKIYVQTNKMECKLKSLGLTNVEQLSNSKYFDDIEVEYDRNMAHPMKCFYLGRIHPDKGTDMIFEALKVMNINGQRLQVDFYGPIEKSYENSFFKKIEKYDFANYKGVLNLVGNGENYYKLSTYDLFLFPTFWHGEGFPGVVLDSFISGVPVLASDWNHNTEVIEDGVNGIIFKTRDIDSFVKKLDMLYSNPKLLKEMRRNAHQESTKFKTENVLAVIDEIIKL